MFERAVDPPATEVVMHRRPRRELTRQQPPRATTPEHVEDAVKDPAHRPLARPATRLRWWDERSQDRPFGIGEVRRIRQRRGHRGYSTAAFSCGEVPNLPFSYSP